MYIYIASPDSEPHISVLSHYSLPMSGIWPVPPCIN